MCAISCMAVDAMAASLRIEPNKKAAADSTATAQTADVEEGFPLPSSMAKRSTDGAATTVPTCPRHGPSKTAASRSTSRAWGEAGAKDGGDIIFANKKFKNFELAFDWKVDKGANSGVFYLAQEIPNQPIYISAPEYQVLDNENHPDAKLGVDGNRQSASLYDMIPAKPQNSKPFGEWNTAKILVYDGTVAHFQNGTQVVEYHLWDPEMERDARQQQIQQGQMAGSLRTAAELRR